MLLVAIKPTTVDYLHLKIIIYADDIKLASDLKQSARFFLSFYPLWKYFYTFSTVVWIDVMRVGGGGLLPTF